MAACVMSVGAGKTALGVAATLGFTRRRALVVTPGSVIRGVFDSAYDHTVSRNVLYGLPGGPLIPGYPPPRVLTLDREDGAIRSVSRENLLSADVIVTNFHSLGDGSDPDHLLAKLEPEDVDLIVVDEAHIAAAESYQRTFAHFSGARKLLMSACFRRLDGKPIEADVVYRYLLIDSIADGNAKNLRVTRFAPDASETTYEMVWPDGRREEIVGRDALLEVIKDERKLARTIQRPPGTAAAPCLGRVVSTVLTSLKLALNDSGIRVASGIIPLPQVFVRLWPRDEFGHRQRPRSVPISPAPGSVERLRIAKVSEAFGVRLSHVRCFDYKSRGLWVRWRR